MLTAIWLLFAQGAMGAFDTFYYHEYKLRLPQQPFARRELLLHAYRDFIYALLFISVGWITWNGWLAGIFLLFLLSEIVITLTDFLEEDRTRKLPPGERVMHALLGIIYGLFLAYLLPNVIHWMRQPLGFGHVYYGYLSWILVSMAIGVLGCGLRDYFSATHQKEWPQILPKKRAS